jgi:hypothetical protein
VLNSLRLRVRRRRESRAIRPYLDAEFYGRQLPDPRSVSPSAMPLHYVTEGWLQGLDATPFFSTSQYLLDHPDVRAVGVNPLAHYVQFGAAEGRRIRTSALAKVTDITGNDSGRAVPDLFRASLISGEIADRSLANPHTFEGAFPLAWVSDATVSGTAPDAFTAPWTGVGPPPFLTSSTARYPIPTYTNFDRLARDLVDPDFYLGRYPDVDCARSEAAGHFMELGWREGRDPNTWFSTSFYLEANPDVRDGGTNPFMHYLTNGRYEGRAPDYLDRAEWEFVLTQKDITTVAQDWVRPESAIMVPPVEAVTSLRRLSRTARRSSSPAQSDPLGVRGLVVAIGSDDPEINVGGVQLCVGVERRQCMARGLDYLYVRPFQPLPKLADPIDSDVPLQLTYNGLSMRHQIRTKDLAQVVLGLARDLGARTLAVSVHGLLGHDPQALGEQIQDLHAERTIYWLHDYFALCSSPTLTRTNLEFCGGPPVESMACQVCTHGAGRRTHQERVLGMLDTIGAEIVAPSGAAAAQFKALLPQWPRSQRVTVLEHGQLEPWALRSGRPGRDTPLTIAFVGHPVPHKGWLDFQLLRHFMSGDPLATFLHMGASSSAQDRDVPFVQVDQKADNVGRTSAALLESNVDAVFIWPTWPETYSLITQEAIAAGCVVITHEDSGNVVAGGLRDGRVLIYGSREELLEAARSGRLRRDLAALVARDSQLYHFRFTGLLPGILGMESQ